MKTMYIAVGRGAFGTFGKLWRRFFYLHTHRRASCLRVPLGLIAPADATASQLFCKRVDFDVATNECHMPDLTLSQAQEMLDWLQTNGLEEPRVRVEDHGIALDWRLPTGGSPPSGGR